MASNTAAKVAQSFEMTKYPLSFRIQVEPL